MEDQRQTGQLPPPPGVVPDFDNPRDAGFTLNIAGLTVCVVLCTIFFFLRCYVKIFIQRRIILADWICFAAWVLVLLYVATIFVMAHYGLGHHAWEVSVENYSQVLKWLYASSIVYIPAAYCVKVTLLLLIAKAFAVEQRVAKGLYIFIWALLFIYTPIQTIKIIICVPIKAYWEPEFDDARCLNQRKVFISDLTVAVLADVVIVMVPVILTWSLKMPLRKKIKIVLMLGAGGVATAVTIFRLVKIVLFLDSKDVTADFVVLDLTTCIELTIGFVCACIPSVNLLFERWHWRLSQRSRASNTPRTGRWPRSIPSGQPRNWWDSVTTKKERAITRMGDDDNEGTRGTIMTTAFPDNEMREVRRPSITTRHLTFDVELAMFTGQGVDSGSESLNKTMHSRMNSLDGRREGWLAPKSDADGDEESSHLSAPTRAMGTWSTIWDGTNTDIPQ